MKLHKVTWERFDVNSYILEYNNTAVIIDCNMNTFSFLQSNNIVPSYIFITHEHFDHIEGIGLIKEYYPTIKIVSTQVSSMYFSDITCNMSRFFDGQNVVEPRADVEISTNKTFQIGNKMYTCYLTPGHTMGSMIISVDNMLFTGDTVLNNIKTPKQGINSSKEHLIDSLYFINNSFSDNTYIFPGHGNALMKSTWKIELSLGKI